MLVQDDVRVSEKSKKLPPGTRSRSEITYISAGTNDNNKIPTALPMVLRLSNMTALVRILSYVRVSGISKMAVCNRKCI